MSALMIMHMCRHTHTTAKLSRNTHATHLSILTVMCSADTGAPLSSTSVLSAVVTT